MLSARDAVAVLTRVHINRSAHTVTLALTTSSRFSSLSREADVLERVCATDSCAPLTHRSFLVHCARSASTLCAGCISASVPAASVIHSVFSSGQVSISCSHLFSFPFAKRARAAHIGTVLLVPVLLTPYALLFHRRQRHIMGNKFSARSGA